MEPVSLVVAALIAGATAGVTDTASTAVSDAYQGLKRLVGALLSVRRPGSEAVLDQDQDEPQVWEAGLIPVLTDTGVGRDDQVLAAARELLALADPSGVASGRYVIDVRGGRGVQIGDHNTQHNTF